MANVVHVTSVQAPSAAAHSLRDGPVRSGPSRVTVSSGNMVTFSAVAFIHISGDCSARHTLPAPGG
nr:hypothetical protein GCM10020093_092100 [Planobispora longispora]